jgi:NTE family protein
MNPLEHDESERADGTALALSGGGFRAVLFHIGVLWRLNELGILKGLARVSSVSGGSIVAGHLAIQWTNLAFDSANVATNFEDRIVDPLRSFCSRNIDVSSVISGALNPCKTAGEQVADEYRDHLGMGVSLQTLPDEPRFVFNSTNFATGVSFRFSKPFAGDYRIGLMMKPTFDVATAVACSSAFPPVLSPMEINISDPDLFQKVEGADLWDQVEFRKRLLLADGGVYDNLGLETVWNRFARILVSDAGKPFEMDASVGALAPKQILRVMDIGLNQALALRKRMLIQSFKLNCTGAFWAINTDIKDFTADNKLAVSTSKISELSSIRTRLDRFKEQEQSELINWGYAVCDAGVRTYAENCVLVKDSPAAFPYPKYPMS